MDFSEKIELYKSRFKFRLDAYATMTIKNSKKIYYCECLNKLAEGCRIGKILSPCLDCPYKLRATVTDEVIRRHLTGEKIAGFYPIFPDGTCQFAAIDLDEAHTFFDLEQIDFYTHKFGLEPYPATSTSKGWHVYFFFDQPIKAGIIRALIGHIGQEIGLSPMPEVFPKQIHSSSLGSLIRTPLSLPDAKKGQCAFINRDRGYKPYDLEEQFGLLRTIKLCNAIGTEKLVKSIGILERRYALNRDYRLFPIAMKPCILRIMSSGTERGQRNETGLIIAAELKRLGGSLENVLGAMGDWNLKNQPSLALCEVKGIVRSAFDHEYIYRCGSDAMKRLLGCEGGKNCPYFQGYLEGMSRNQKPPIEN